MEDVIHTGRYGAYRKEFDGNGVVESRRCNVCRRWDVRTLKVCGVGMKVWWDVWGVKEELELYCERCGARRETSGGEDVGQTDVEGGGSGGEGRGVFWRWCGGRICNLAN